VNVVCFTALRDVELNSVVSGTTMSSVDTRDEMKIEFTNAYCHSVNNILVSCLILREPGSSLATGWTTGRSRFDPRQGQRIFPLASVSRPALGPTQPPVQWVPGVLSRGLKFSWGVTLTTHPHLVPRSRMSRSYTSSPPKRLHGV
jgi:hypothetical protein